MSDLRDDVRALFTELTGHATLALSSAPRSASAGT